MKLLAAASLALALCLAPLSLVRAGDQMVLATVNDVPITSLDIDSRINLWKVLGQKPRTANPRKEALNAVIDDIAKIQAATDAKLDPPKAEMDKRLDGVAKSFGTDSAGLKAKLSAQGISMAAMMQYLTAQASFNRLLGAKYRERVDVSDAEVDAKMNEIKRDIANQLAKIKADPRMQPVTVYKILEVNFPADADSLEPRFADAAAYTNKFKGCGSARAAASGIFNVQIGKTVEADGRKIPPPLKAAFSKAGVGRAVGPIRTPKGFQVYGYCGTRKITPPAPNAKYPSRDQVKNFVLNEKYGSIEKKYAGQFRTSVIIEYRDPSYAQ
ncbi:MAG: hypothetical protein U1E15_08690 [Hyphomicrobiales bacterium]